MTTNLFGSKKRLQDLKTNGVKTFEQPVGQIPKEDAFLPDPAVSMVVHQLAESLSGAMEAKDRHTRAHSEEVAEGAVVLARAMCLDERFVHAVHVAGHLHDIGKIGIPDSILQKKGPLTTSERAWIRRHPDMGAAILAPVQALNRSGITDMVRHHHERYDGGGYPCGLKGAEIPLGARILAVVDTVSAMTQDRPYRERMTFDEAVREVVACEGTQFDPQVAEAFVVTQGRIRKAMEKARRIKHPMHAVFTPWPG